MKEHNHFIMSVLPKSVSQLCKEAQNLMFFWMQVVSSPTVVQVVTQTEALVGDNWDIYLITLLSGLLVLVIMWRWRH